MIRIHPIVVLVLLSSVSYGFQNPDPDGQSVEAYGGAGAYGLTSCSTTSIYDYRVATVQYKKRWNYWQVGGAAAYINRVERYKMDAETGEGMPIDEREALNLGGAMMFGSFLYPYVEVTLGCGFLAGRDQKGLRGLPWPHAIIKAGKMDMVYVAGAFGDPRPPYHTVKAWIGGYPSPDLHLYGGVGTIHPVMPVSPFVGVDWRHKDLFAVSLTMEYHIPDNKTVFLQNSLFGSMGFSFYF